MPSPEEIAEIQRRMMEAAVPGPAHERLASLTGEWDLEVRMRPAPGADPVVLEGTARNRTILGGRFLLTTRRWGAGDEETEAWTLYGYDGRHGEFTALELDTWGTYWVSARGDGDPDSDRIVMAGEEHDPILGHTRAYDFVLEIVDADTYRTAIVFHDEAHTGGGEPFTAIETVHRRRLEGGAR